MSGQVNINLGDEVSIILAFFFFFEKSIILAYGILCLKRILNLINFHFQIY